MLSGSHSAFLAGATAADPLRRALRAVRGAFVGVGLISCVVNVLYLTGSFFMLQVYDRVIPSRSLPTLVGLAGLAGALYIFQGVLDALRGRILTRIGLSLDQDAGARIFDMVIRLPLRMRQGEGDGLQPMRDLAAIRGFLAGGGPSAFSDLPWMPLYIGICFLFHPWIGLTATLGALALVLLAVATETMTRAPTRAASQAGARRLALAEAGRRNAEAVTAMGMGGRLRDLWSAANAVETAALRRASDVAGGLGSLSKVLRMMLQSGVLAVGAFLVIRQEATGGVIIASSILTSRALAPIETAIAHWKGFLAARQGWGRLQTLIRLLPEAPSMMALPAPIANLNVEDVSVTPPGSARVVVQNARFRLEAGEGLGIIGPSASGKSSLVRAVVGVWQSARGTIRLDGAALDQWSLETLGRHVGYLPQDVELFAGTVAQNIARLEANPDPAAVIAAARAAGVHDMILRLENGYETPIGEHGADLAKGQRQRIALARALYGDPFLVILDEPNSSLDQEGEAALTEAIRGIRARGGIVIVVAHRSSALAGVSHVLMMNAGRVQAFGTRDDVLSRVLARPAAAAPFKVVGGEGAAS